MNSLFLCRSVYLVAGLEEDMKKERVIGHRDNQRVKIQEK